MLSPIELVPVEIARRITILLRPEWLPDLLAASRAVRRVFVPGESEVPFVRRHLRPQFEEFIPICGMSRMNVPTLPFQKLPDVYAVGWLAACWDLMADPADKDGARRVIACMVFAFPDLEAGGVLRFRYGPQRPIARMERIFLKALSSQCVRIKFKQESRLAFSLAAMMDSVATVEVTLVRRFPEEVKIKGPADGAGKVVMSADADEDTKSDSFALSMAFVAEVAACHGAVQVLDYALQHPLVPVAFNFYRRFRIQRFFRPPLDEFEHLINRASRPAAAHMHIVHYLLGNPLPLAPPPASRPLRPGTLSAGLEWQEPILFGPQTELVELSHQNPISSLTQVGSGTEPPLQSILRYRDYDPLPAVIYLLDQGAPTNRERPASLGPLHLAAAAEHKRPELVRLLVERGANVDDRAGNGFTPLHVAAKDNNVEMAMELLACGADRDADVRWVEEEGEPDIVSLLGFSMECRSQGWTPLKVALGRKNHDVARVLLRAGATLMARRKGGDDEHIDAELRNQLLN
ncbi:hypothetical protein HDU96_006365 [Phlyctochytrium bullatum]|nr:hypothetical protein HDU96_006365 [Phlyctochytrium bullatum]